MKEFVNYKVLAIEHASGGTLSDLIKLKNKNKLKLTEHDCSKIVKGILLGLRHIHANDYVHRDLKPSNIVISNIGDLESVKIVDFGLAIKYQSKFGLDGTCGTLLYQSPEQLFGVGTYGKSIDIWALGFIMYELISGSHPLWKKGQDRHEY